MRATSASLGAGGRAGGGGAEVDGGAVAHRDVVALDDARGDFAGEQQRFGVFGVVAGLAEEAAELHRQAAGGQLQGDDGEAEGGVFEAERARAGDRQRQRREHDGAADPVDATAAGHHPGGQRDQPEQVDRVHPLVLDADDQDRGGGGEGLLDLGPDDAQVGELEERGDDDHGEAGDPGGGQRQGLGAVEDQGDPEDAEGDAADRRCMAGALDRIVALDGEWVERHEFSHLFRQNRVPT